MRVSAAACLAFLVAACGGTNMMTIEPTTYVPFDEPSYQAARAPLDFYTKVRALSSATDFSKLSFGTFDVDMSSTPAARCAPKAAPAANTMAAVFLVGDACNKVVTRIEPHAYGAGAGTSQLGEVIHAGLVKGLQDGAAATDDTALDVAQERIKKQLLRYFYESIVEGTARRSPSGWDQAFAHWGGDLDGTHPLGLALLAKGRDLKLKTTFESDVFNLLLRGRKILAARKLTGNASLKPGDAVDLDATIAAIDSKLQLLFGHYSGGEFAGWTAKVADRSAIYVEGSVIAFAIADYMKTKNPSGHATLSAALQKPESQFVEADAKAIVQAIEATFGIVVVAE